MFNDSDNQTLGRPILMKEIGGVMQSSAKDKSPSPDGWDVELFIHFKELIGHAILAVTKESRTKGFIPGAINATFIALIPKKEHDSYNICGIQAHFPL